MSFLRSLAVFFLSLIFTSSVLLTISSYNIGNLVQKNSIKNFIRTESSKYINQECDSRCNEALEYKETCVQLCLAEATNQTEASINSAVDSIYQQKFFNAVSLDDLSFFLTQYFLFLIIGIVSGILLTIASQTRFLTLGKNFITISVSLFISSVTPEFIMASINLPFNLGQSIKDYFFPNFSKLTYYGITFLIVGVALIVINYLLERKKNKAKKSN